ncbi:hypothetical protein [uncultured Campylobacter sp.]|uniref:hypothetical protein n=1 Tax=uncultured Campylobacter sp. TaxID=218934 RepID=UPI0026211BBE|nr:hypothetical protein [uncultured Campylobacter sp.]
MAKFTLPNIAKFCVRFAVVCALNLDAPLSPLPSYSEPRGLKGYKAIISLSAQPIIF